MARQRLGQLVVVCGHNADAHAELATRKWAVPTFRPKILGFVDNVDEYMSAADILVTKAGPGTIAEAMIKGLPCLLTSFMVTEEGNVSIVTEAGAGAFVPDTEPEKVAERVLAWLHRTEELAEMTRCTRKLARPHAALEIVKRIGAELLNNEERRRKVVGRLPSDDLAEAMSIAT
eukprot:gnl/TRDRNA2_/TRDRNA2_150862_c2_seq1.p1 gnl/TRDRNA2_/TRDRNA2_150862_c2~~gnl/TRDRNA2_/TRDRNA2_150862_c2_seq1.p1  ORF type:complete len:175 (+),score=33.49 gnl/TRDRNA2_/TRDRNA2_150862_c2_seq1:2-526(+)